MTSKDYAKISVEAYALLESLLVRHYKKSYEESYQILRKKIEAKFLGKDTNIKYRAMLIDNLEDLVQTVILRLVAINSKSLAEKKEAIRNPELMAYKITELVYLEELRQIRKRLTELAIDDESPEKKALPLSQPASDEIEAIIKEIIQECYDACVESLPVESKDLFLAYYPNIILDPKELVARRKQLAQEEAEMTPAQAQGRTPEQEARTINNLQSKVNKLRKSHVEECVRKCVEAKQSRHVRLNYLSQR